MGKSSLMKMSGRLEELFKVPAIPPRPRFTKTRAYLRKDMFNVKKADSKRDA